MTISIIIVHYQIETTIFKCIESIFNQNISNNDKIEVIVVDNGSKDKFKERLFEKFQKIKFIKSPKNLGYGEGNNLGVEKATGEILFFLNPDTILQKDCIKRILKFWKKNPSSGAVAPSLLHQNNKKFAKQSSQILTPIRALFAHSLIHKIWPNNPVANKFWLTDLDKDKDRLTEVCPGTAFTIKRTLFKKVGSFDKNLFLYFEEYDLFIRLKKENKKSWMLGKANVIHKWGETTQSINTKSIYQTSFKYYLTKHYGIIGMGTFSLIKNLKTLIALLAIAVILLMTVIGKYAN